MCQLLKYWEQLENRTKQVVDLLRFASMARCGMHEKKDGGKVPSRAERKMREKQKKALLVMDELVKRNDNGSCSVKTTFYDSIGILLEERANMRSLWLDRENDGVFHSMPVDYRPLPVPLQFGVTNSSSKIEAIGQSPLLGTADDLLRLRDGLIKCGSAYISQKRLDLPEMKDLDRVLKEKESEDAVFSQKRETKNDEQKEQPSTAEEIEVDKLAKEEEIKQKETVSIRRPITTAADHQKDFKWKGWSSIKVGLEMQEPWAALLLNGTKTIETRVYDIPKALLGKKIDILESKQGKDKLSSLSDVMIGEECSNAVKRIGWCIFDRVIIYRYKAKFESDESKHLVSPTSNYGWKDDTKIVYGWVVAKSGKYSNGKKKPLKRMNCAIRRMRSLFEIQS